MHVMLDLETMSTGHNAAIVSIGAVKFDRDQILNTFYTNVDLASCVDVGLEIDPNTIMWWLEQSQEAQEALLGQTIDITGALEKFNRWLGVNYDGMKIWGNGSDFDNVILRNAYKQCNITAPWKYSGNMCYRTIKNLYSGIKIQREGVQHNALQDAVDQANHLIEINKEMKCL